MNPPIRSRHNGPCAPDVLRAPTPKHPHPDALDLDELLDMLERDTEMSRADLRECLNFLRDRREITVETCAAAPSGKVVDFGPEAAWTISPDIWADDADGVGEV